MPPTTVGSLIKSEFRVKHNFHPLATSNIKPKPNPDPNQTLIIPNPYPRSEQIHRLSQGQPSKHDGELISIKCNNDLLSVLPQEVYRLSRYASAIEALN